MKKSLLLGITGITLVAVTATTLYAQTVAGSSIVDKMKAAMRPSFTLSADLNPGQTGFESAPITGKKTGDILTAGEWNRMLELVSDGSGVSAAGSQNTISFKSVIFDGTNCPNDNCVIKWQNGVSSVKRIWTGVYRVVWSSPMTNANYLTMAHSSQFTYSGDGDGACDVPPATKTVNDWAFCQVSWAMRLTDSNSVSVFAIDYGANGGSNGSTSSCPSWFVAVGSYCIEPTMGPTGKDWYEASVACADKGGQLCSWSEWSTACQKSKLTDVVFGSTGKYEWIDDYSIGNQGIADPIVHSDCKYLSRQADSTKAANTGYRCCASQK